MEFLSSYDFGNACTLEKGNVVADALSRKYVDLSMMMLEMRNLEFISSFNFRPPSEQSLGILVTLEVRPMRLDRIGISQKDDAALVDILDKLEKGE